MHHIPSGYHTITPYVTVEGAPRLIEFLQTVFDATQKERMDREDGSIRHAKILIGDSLLMISDAPAEFKAQPANLYVYVPDTDAAYRKALAAGATSLMEPADQFYGDRNAGVKDSFGISWWIATHIEDVSPEEMRRRSSS